MKKIMYATVKNLVEIGGEMRELMKHNSSTEKIIPATDKQIIEQLWSLLDDIDTASDMFKPKKTSFYSYVMKKAALRFKHVGSDGYNLKWHN